MDWDYTENGKYFEVELDNKKKYRVEKTEVENLQRTLELDEVKAIETWLEDKEILTNAEQEELDKKAKENKSQKVIQASAKDPKKKTQRERVKKDNPDKEFLINLLNNALINAEITTNVANKGKIIEFSYNNKEFKLDLIEKRAKKE